MVTTLPAGMLLASSERRELERYVGALGGLLERTPMHSAAAEAETLVLVSKMMMALPAQKTGAAGAEATGEAYCAALDDIPPWAVAAAIRRWYRGDIPTPSPRSPPHNFDFRPGPAKLRSIAFCEAAGVRGRALELQRLLEAEERVQYSEDHRSEMLAKLQTVMPSRPKHQRAEAAGTSPSLAALMKAGMA